MRACMDKLRQGRSPLLLSVAWNDARWRTSRKLSPDTKASCLTALGYGAALDAARNHVRSIHGCRINWCGCDADRPCIHRHRNRAKVLRHSLRAHRERAATVRGVCVRPSYADLQKLVAKHSTIADAAEEAGVAIRTVQTWIAGCAGRKV